MEAIIKKVEKLFNLANSNPNSNEAIAAAEKAQELIAKYNVDVNLIGSKTNVSEKIIMKTDCNGTGYKWRYQLSQIVANNFRCKRFFSNYTDVTFYGFETDVNVAFSTYEFLFKIGNKLANRYYNKYKKENPYYYDFSGIKNRYLLGFMDGIEEKLNAQCVALMIVIPKEVKEEYAELSKTFGKPKNIGLNAQYNHKAFEQGKRDGRNAIGERHIEGGKSE